VNLSPQYYLEWTKQTKKQLKCFICCSFPLRIIWIFFLVCFSSTSFFFIFSTPKEMSQKPEGKKVPREANPYSFKNFTPGPSSSAAPFPDIFDTKDLPLPSSGSTSTGHGPHAPHHQPDIFEEKKKKPPASSVSSANAGSGPTKEENPFSFFKYVKEDGRASTFKCTG